MTEPASDRFQQLGGLDLAGGGQVVVRDGYAYVGHMKSTHGTTIIDVSDPRKPVIACALDSVSRWSHSHKVRVAGDLMITNVEQDRRHILRKGEKLSDTRARLQASLGREASREELANALGVAANELPLIEAAVKRGYEEGGFRVWDIRDPASPRLLSYVRTFGFGVHRFDMDEHYAYISTEMEGYVGNILVIYDISTPDRPREVSRWWLPGQHVAGGETPTWQGYGHRLHHALRAGNELWAAVWHAGLRVIDISDIGAPRTRAAFNYHPWIVEPTHTVLPVSQPINGRRLAIVADEEHQHRHGQPHAGLWVFDVTDLDAIVPLSTFHVSEMDSPWSRAEGRFGMHQFQEHLDDTLVFCAWFSGGLRVVDIGDPARPREAGYFIPAPRPGEASPQSNDVDVDERGLVFVLDRNQGLDILEYRP